MVKTLSLSLFVGIKKMNETLHEEEFVVFNLADEMYGVEASQVKEITTMPEIENASNTPDFVEGTVNLHDKTVTVVDLRKRFGIPTNKKSDDRRIIVIEWDGTFIGMAIDGVTKVMELSVHSIEDSPDLASDVTLDLIKGVGKLEDGTNLIVVNLEKVLSSDEIKTIRNKN